MASCHAASRHTSYGAGGLNFCGSPVLISPTQRALGAPPRPQRRLHRDHALTLVTRIATCPIGRRPTLPNKSVEARMRPIGESLDMAVLDRIPVAVIDMPGEILLVADQVFPVTPLPQADSVGSLCLPLVLTVKKKQPPGTIARRNVALPDHLPQPCANAMSLRHKPARSGMGIPVAAAPRFRVALSGRLLRQDRPFMTSQIAPKARISAGRRPTLRLYFANTRAFWNIRNQGVLPLVHCDGQNDPDTPAIVRSGCGIRMVTRPSRLVTEAMPAGEPFGFAG